MKKRTKKYMEIRKFWRKYNAYHHYIGGKRELLPHEADLLVQHISTKNG